ncbi:MAG: hypothetical protein AB1631_32050 [Acidobacteriota bacterium]
MRTPVSQLTPEQVAALPRVTRWRALKRGWVALDYHKGGERWTPRERDDTAILTHFSWDDLYRIAWGTWLHVSAFLNFPRWFTADDFVQEAVIAVWRQGHTFRGEVRDPQGFVRHVMRLEGARVTRRRWERGIIATDFLRPAPSPAEQETQWVRAMLDFCRSELSETEYERLEQYVFGERRVLPAGTLHKLHRIFHTEERCEECRKEKEFQL